MKHKSPTTPIPIVNTRLAHWDQYKVADILQMIVLQVFSHDERNV